MTTTWKTYLLILPIRGKQYTVNVKIWQRIFQQTGQSVENRKWIFLIEDGGVKLLELLSDKICQCF